MTEQQLSTYFTMELIASYSPQALSSMKEPEIKLWLCPETGLPVFGNAAYGGPSSSITDLPIIGHPTIHIRVPNTPIESSEDDASVKHLLYTIYQQICQQIHLLEIQPSLGTNLEKAIVAKQMKIDLLTTLFRDKEQEHATEVVH